MAGSRRSSLPISNHGVPTLIVLRRLEAATSRLEDIATSVATFDQTGSPGSISTNAIATPSRDAAGPSQPGPSASGAPTTSPPAKAEPLPLEVQEFDKLMEGELSKFVKLSEALDPLLGLQASHMLCCDAFRSNGSPGNRSSKDL
jgi:adenylyl cyclase-associated protein